MYLGQSSLVRDLLAKFDQYPAIFSQSVEPIPTLDQFFKNRTFFQDLLRTGGVVPETGDSDAGVELLQLLTFAIKVKVTSGGRRYDCSDHPAMQFLHDTWGLLRCN